MPQISPPSGHPATRKMPQKRPKYRDDEEIDDDQVQPETRTQQRQKYSTRKEEALLRSENQEQHEEQEDNQNQLGAHPRGDETRPTQKAKRREPTTGRREEYGEQREGPRTAPPAPGKNNCITNVVPPSNTHSGLQHNFGARRSLPCLNACETMHA